MQPDKGNTDTFRVTVSQVYESFHYRIEAGDGRSREYRVEVVKRPAIEKLNLVYTLPDYTGPAKKRIEDTKGDIAAIPGTTVTVEIQATKPLQQAKLKIKDGAEIPLDKADDGTWQASFVLWNSELKATPPERGVRVLNAPTQYQVLLTDTEGYDNGDPLWRPINLLRDQPPNVAITTPGKDVQVKPYAKVSLTIEARDDYGVGEVKVLYRVGDAAQVKELARFTVAKPDKQQTSNKFDWRLDSGTAFKSGEVVQYWAVAVDRNNLTGPGQAESRKYFLFVTTPEAAVAKMAGHLPDYAQIVEELLRLQKENRTQTASGMAFDGLIKREELIRTQSRKLARIMEKDVKPLVTMVQTLDDLAVGPMAEVVKLLETGRDAAAARLTPTPLPPGEGRGGGPEMRTQSLPIQDKIITELEGLLARLQRNEQARKALAKLEKKDKPAQQQVVKTLTDLLKDLDRMLQDKSELASKFEKLPKKPGEDPKEEDVKDAMRELDQFEKKWEKWTKGKVNELTKLPEGFIDDFQVRPDVKKIFEEIEKQAERLKAQKIETALEDLGSSLATKMKEDLETWLVDAPDNLKWVMEEPLDQKKMKIPEMPLPKALEDLVGDLLQKADEFDEEADDVTSAWGDNLDQAGWGVIGWTDQHLLGQGQDRQ